jgi:uncharacterized protein YkwD
MQFAARIFVALLVIGSMSFAGGSVAEARTSCNGAGASLGPENAGQIERATVCLINARRSSHGLARLHSNRLLHLAGRRHSREMVRNRYMEHTSPAGETFVDRIRQTGYLRSTRSWSLGENIACGVGSNATPRAIVQQWMNSPPHRHAILSSSFQSVGVGAAPGTPGGDQGATYTADFGSRTLARGH